MTRLRLLGWRMLVAAMLGCLICSHAFVLLHLRDLEQRVGEIEVRRIAEEHGLPFDELKQ